MTELPHLALSPPNPSSPPSFPTSERSESPPLSSLPTSSNDSPLVESPPSSPVHKHIMDESPANNEPLQKITLPALTSFGIKTCPEELEACPDRHLVFGFPIPTEWFPHRYQGMKEAGLELGSYKAERAMASQLIVDICEEVCDEMWPEASMTIGPVTVWCLRDGNTQTCELLKIGTTRQAPSFDVAMEMANRVVKYGIAEKPDWFPLYGMY